MAKLRCAVIGVGYLGRFHAQKYQQINDVELIAVCDKNQITCENVANELNVLAIKNYTDLFDKVDAVSIATTTNEHFPIARDFLLRGIHTLIEKPMTTTVAEAEELIAIAEQSGAKLQIGHLERFNAAYMAVEPLIIRPLFIDSQRLAPFTPRGADVNVILDLMIHDIDIIQSMVKSPITSVTAQGAPVLSKAIDIANARISFENGCVANVVASRISFKTKRKTRIFQPTSYVSIDYHQKNFAVFKKGDDEIFPGIPNIVQSESSFEKTDALLLEIESFVHAILMNKKPLVTGQDGCTALKTAIKISSLIENNLENIYEKV